MPPLMCPCRYSSTLAATKVPPLMCPGRSMDVIRYMTAWYQPSYRSCVWYAIHRITSIWHLPTCDNVLPSLSDGYVIRSYQMVTWYDPIRLSRDTINGRDPIYDCMIRTNGNRAFRRGTGACDSLHVVMVMWSDTLCGYYLKQLEI